MIKQKDAARMAQQAFLGTQPQRKETKMSTTETQVQQDDIDPAVIETNVVEAPAVSVATTSIATTAVKAASSGMSAASVSLLFTLDLTGQERIPDLKQLNAVESKNGNTYNLYNPFKGLSKADKEKGGKFKGLFRQQFNQILEFASEVENANIIMIGRHQSVNTALTNVASELTKAIVASMPFQPNDEIVKVIGEDGVEENAAVLRFSDFISVDSWVNSNSILGRADGETSIHSNIVINFVVSAPSLIYSKDLTKSILQAFNSLVGIAAKAETEINLLGCVRINAEHLVDAQQFEALGALVENEFDIYTRRCLEQNVSNQDYSWTPVTKKDIASKLLNDETDILLFNILGSEEQGEETE